MGSTTIKGVHDNLQTFISGTSALDTNISLATMADLTGMEAAIPSSTITGGGDDLSLNNFEILGTNAVGNTTGYYKYMKNGAALGDFSNMFFISVAGTYKFRAFKNSTTIYKNGSSLATITTAMSSTTASLAVGDRIEGNKPFMLNNNTYPALTGAYAGFAGYTFATRVDRNALMGLLIISLEASNSIQVAYTTVGNSEVTSLTVEQTFNSVTQYSAVTCNLSQTRNYFIYATKPICVYRMRASLDTMPLYPMTSEPKFGWYSTNGHILMTNNATANRAGTTTQRKILIGNSNGVLTTEVNTTPAAVSVRIDTDISTTAKGGHRFLGPGVKTFSDPNDGGTADPMQLFACEQQADGDGSEMSPHVAYGAMQKFTVMPDATSNYIAFIAKSSGSISRYDSNGCLHGTQTFTGSSTYSVYTTRFTTAIEGDFFSANTECFGFTDLNASQDDETVLFMGDSIDAPTCGTGGTTCREITLARSTAAEGACARACTLDCTTYYTTTPADESLAVGGFIYENSSCSCEGDAPLVLVYSDKCGLRTGFCYTMDPDTCEIAEITEC